MPRTAGASATQSASGFSYLAPATPLPGLSEPTSLLDSLVMLVSAGIFEPLNQSVDMLFTDSKPGRKLAPVWFRA